MAFKLKYVTDLGVQFIMQNEGFTPTAKYDINHYRVGYYTDSIYKKDGSFTTVIKGDTITKDEAYKTLVYRIHYDIEKNIERYPIFKQLGWGSFDAIASWIYNHGSGRLKNIAAALEKDIGNFEKADWSFPNTKKIWFSYSRTNRRFQEWYMFTMNYTIAAHSVTDEKEPNFGFNLDHTDMKKYLTNDTNLVVEIINNNKKKSMNTILTKIKANWLYITIALVAGLAVYYFFGKKKGSRRYSR